MASQLDKIKALQARLKAVQAQKQKQKLSERNMVEIVAKLTQLKLVDLIMSTDGKEYITPDHARRQIIETVETFGSGRLSISEISEHVKIEYSTVERFVEEVLNRKEEKENFRLINNQLISAKYFTKKAAEICELVIYHGKMTLPELAIKYDLPLDTLASEVLTQIRSDPRNFVIQNEPDPVIYAQEYQLLAKMKILGSLRGVSFPVSLSEILKVNSLDKNFDILTIVKDFISSKNGKEPQLNGEIQGKTTFVPNIYLEAQKKWIVNTFKSNMYIDFSLLAKIGIGSDQKRIVTETLKNHPGAGGIDVKKDLLFIKNGVLNRDLFADLEAQLFETERFLAVEDIMPEFIDNSEYDEILENFLDQENFILLDEIIFKKSFIEKTCFENFKKMILTSAETEAEKNYKRNAANKLKAKNSNQAHDQAEDEPASKGKGKKGKKGKNAAKKAEARAQSHEQEAEENFDVEFGSVLPEKEQFCQVLEEFLNTKFMDDFDYNSSYSADDIAQVLVTYLEPKIVQAFIEYCNDISLQLAEKKNSDLKEFGKNLEIRLQERFDLARISNNGLNFIKKSKFNSTSLIKSCENYLNSKIFQEIFDIMLVLASGVGPFDVEFEETLSNKDRKILKNALPGSVKDVFVDSKFNRFNESGVKTSDADFDFEETLDNLLELAGSNVLSLGRIKCDKRKDKEFITNFLAAQKSGFDSGLYHEKLHILTILVFNLVTKNLVMVSGRAIQDLISFISTFVMADNKFDELLDLLVDVKETIVDKLKNGTIEEFDKELDDNLKKLKSMVENFSTKGAEVDIKNSGAAAATSDVKASPIRTRQKSASKKSPASPSVHPMTTRSETTRDKSQESKQSSSEVEVVPEIGKLEDFEAPAKSSSSEDSSSEEEVVVKKPAGRRRNRRAD